MPSISIALLTATGRPPPIPWAFATPPLARMKAARWRSSARASPGCPPRSNWPNGRRRARARGGPYGLGRIGAERRLRLHRLAQALLWADDQRYGLEATKRYFDTPWASRGAGARQSSRASPSTSGPRARAGDARPSAQPRRGVQGRTGLLPRDLRREDGIPRRGKISRHGASTGPGFMRGLQGADRLRRPSPQLCARPCPRRQRGGREDPRAVAAASAGRRTATAIACHTAEGVLTARHVIVATNGYTPEDVRRATRAA